MQARPYVGFDYTDSSVAVLMLPEVPLAREDAWAYLGVNLGDVWSFVFDPSMQVRVLSRD